MDSEAPNGIILFPVGRINQILKEARPKLGVCNVSCRTVYHLSEPDGYQLPTVSAPTRRAPRIPPRKICRGLPLRWPGRSCFHSLIAGVSACPVCCCVVVVTKELKEQIVGAFLVASLYVSGMVDINVRDETLRWIAHSLKASTESGQSSDSKSQSVR